MSAKSSRSCDDGFLSGAFSGTIGLRDNYSSQASMNESSIRESVPDKDPHDSEKRFDSDVADGNDERSQDPMLTQSGPEGHISEARYLMKKAGAAVDDASRRRMMEAAQEQMRVVQEGIDEENIRKEGMMAETQRIAQTLESYDTAIAENVEPEDASFFRLPESAQVYKDREIVRNEQGELEEKIAQERRALEDVQQEMTFDGTENTESVSTGESAVEGVESLEEASREADKSDDRANKGPDMAVDNVSVKGNEGDLIERKPIQDEKTGQESVELVEMKRSTEEGEGDDDSDGDEKDERRLEEVERASVVMRFDSPLSVDDSFRKCAKDENLRAKLVGYKDENEIMNACREKFAQEVGKDPVLESEYFMSASWTVHVNPSGKIERFVPNPDTRDVMKALFGEVLVRSKSEKWSAVEGVMEGGDGGVTANDTVGLRDVFSYLRSLESAYGMEDAKNKSIAKRVFDISHRNVSR